MFDLFHTLVDTEHLRPEGFDGVTAVAAVLGADPGDFARYWSDTYVERETTTVRLVDRAVRYCEAKGIAVANDKRQRIDDLFGVCKDDALRYPRPEMMELVASLAATTPLGVLSNCHEREVRCWSESPLAQHVKVIGRSCDIGVIKPDPRTYQWVLEQLGVDAGDAIYVGNGSSDELDGARAVGFGTVVHCNIFDAHNGLVQPAEQQRRASTADVSVSTVAQLRRALEP